MTFRSDETTDIIPHELLDSLRDLSERVDPPECSPMAPAVVPDFEDQATVPHVPAWPSATPIPPVDTTEATSEPNQSHLSPSHDYSALKSGIMLVAVSLTAALVAAQIALRFW